MGYDLNHKIFLSKMMCPVCCIIVVFSQNVLFIVPNSYVIKACNFTSIMKPTKDTLKYCHKASELKVCLIQLICKITTGIYMLKLMILMLFKGKS